ncbi:MAG: UTP--glucose-1-phosphate uridylyltransferase [Planctomycetota bacterium]|jgi:UDP-N-acetylglucosamine/UDP-N-acetylgalactosamine diphosphorylase
MRSERAIRARLEQSGQEYLAEHLDTLEGSSRDRLLRRLDALDFDMVDQLRAGRGLAVERHGIPEPVPYVRASERGENTEAAEAGRAALAEGKVAFALLAGGQASRLRADGPKGAFPIGPRTSRSLFQVLVEHIVRAGRDYGALPRLAVTSSSSTDVAIRAFFEKHGCFGMDRDRLNFACQASLPALDADGKLLLASPDRVFTSPDGHGGALLGLRSAGILDYWAAAGIEVICTFQIDNPLLEVVDADFLGRLATAGVPLASKIVLKTDPAEKVGVIAAVDGKPAIVEYSEIPPELAQQRDDDGQLRFRLGSIAVHAFSLDFLKGALDDPLPLHVANKEIPCVNGEGAVVRRPGRKFERFAFDLFPRASGICVVETTRDREYAPVKNAEGVDSPATSRAALDREYRRWYFEAGRTPPDDEFVELSPLEALGPEDLV